MQSRVGAVVIACAIATALFFGVPYTRAIADSWAATIHYDTNGYAYVNCAAGCGAAAAAPLNGGASGVATAANQAIAIFGYNGTTLDSLKDTSGSLWVSCQAGCNSSAPLAGNASGVAAAANQSVGLAAFNGTTLDALKEASGALYVNCQTGCNSSAPLAGNASAVTAAANQAVALAAYNGSTLDALRESSGNLFVNLQTALPTGANTIGAVAEGGTWNVGLNTGSNTIGAISNSSFNATQSGTWTVQPGNTANTTPWLTTISQGGNSATVSAGGALKVDNSAVTQPVTGTVTANEGGAPWTVTNRTGSSGNVAAPLCDQSVAINTSTSGYTQLVALSAGKKIYVCSFFVQANGTVNVNLAYGTGTTCGTGTTALTGPMPEPTPGAGIAPNGGSSPLFTVPTGNALCVNLSAATQVSGALSYAQY